MKKTEENRYPHSATLFRFCKEALELRHQNNIKVIDQDVGAILGYDPADCSHWKKGKKNIRALAMLRTIADHLHTDERLLVDIAAGNMGLDEALFEFKGYGSFQLNPQTLDQLRKDFFKNPEPWQGAMAQGKTFEDVFDLDHQAIKHMAQQVLALGKFHEPPVFLPELYQAFPRIRWVVVPPSPTMQNFGDKTESPRTPLTVEKTDVEGQLTYTVFCHEPEVRPYLRHLGARILYEFLVDSKHSLCPASLADSPRPIHEVASNIFALNVLMPGPLLRKEVEKAWESHDLIQQLAHSFWLSKTLVNERIKDYVDTMR